MQPPVNFIRTQQCWQSVHNRRWNFGAITNATSINRKEKLTKDKNDNLSVAIPGVRHILESQNRFVFKIFWVLIISCSFLICIYQVSDRFQFFLSGPIQTRVTVTRNESIKFPSLTICIPEEKQLEIRNLLKMKFENSSISYCYKKWWDLLPEHNVTTLWNQMSTGHIFGMVAIFSRVNVSFGSKDISYNNTEMFFGTCTQISIQKLVPFRGDDYLVAFSLIGLSYSSWDCFSSHRNAILYLFHHDDEDVTYKFLSKVLTLQELSSISLGITAKRFRSLDRRSAHCASIAAVNKCERTCIEKYFEKNINCRLPYMPFDDIPLCNTADDASKVYESVFYNASTFVYSKNCVCPKICEEIIYTQNLKFTSTIDSPRMEYFFEDNAIYDMEEYYAYTFIPFLCDIGGNLGLYLGLSIPAIIELVQSIIFYTHGRFFPKN